MNINPLLYMILIVPLFYACDAPPAPDTSKQIPNQQIQEEQMIQIMTGEKIYLPTITGTWLHYSQTSTCVDLGRSIEQLNRTLYLVETTQQDHGVLSEKWQACQIELSPIIGIQAKIPPSLQASVYPVNTEQGLVIGKLDHIKYQSGPLVELWGANFEHPMSDPFVISSDDPRIEDKDMDGNIGVTLEIGSACKAYMVQRNISFAQGIFVEEDRIKGDILATSEQTILDASAPLCKTKYSTRDQPERSIFERVRIDGQGGSVNLDLDGNGKIKCEEVIEAKDQLFDRLALNDESCSN